MKKIQDKKKNSDIEQNVIEIIKFMGENPARAGLEKTPQRVRESFQFLTSGYSKDIQKVLNGAVFEEPYDEMVVLKDIEIFSLCEHHLLPFYGKCHVAYVPDGKIVGLSKIPRLVEVFARRLQVQERLTTQIANCINETLQPLGVGVIIEAFHLCMTMRGVEKQNAFAITSSMLGAFRNDRGTRMEFLNLVRAKPR